MPYISKAELYQMCLDAGATDEQLDGLTRDELDDLLDRLKAEGDQPEPPPAEQADETAEAPQDAEEVGKDADASVSESIGEDVTPQEDSAPLNAEPTEADQTESEESEPEEADEPIADGPDSDADGVEEADPEETGAEAATVPVDAVPAEEAEADEEPVPVGNGNRSELLDDILEAFEARRPGEGFQLLMLLGTAVSRLPNSWGRSPERLAEIVTRGLRSVSGKLSNTVQTVLRRSVNTHGRNLTSEERTAYLNDVLAVIDEHKDHPEFERAVAEIVASSTL